MDPIFGFIFDEAGQELPLFDKEGLYALPDRHNAPLPNVPSAHSLLDEYHLDKHQIDQTNFPVITPEVRTLLAGLIEEYLTDGITLKPFIHKVRHALGGHDSSGVFTWVLRTILESGHTRRMATFLEENGVSKEELEAASINKKDNAEGSDDEFGIGEKRKRHRKRVSISQGLRSPPNKWSKAESQRLIRLVFEYGDKSWKKIAEQLGGGKTGAQCAQHWKRVLSPEIRKGSWDDQEEALLYSLVAKHGQSWKNIAAEIKTRTDIQCRYQYQKACLSRQCEWLAQEDALLNKKVALCLQERRTIIWTDVSKFIARAKLTKIPRTALECKERWSSINGNNLTAFNNTSNVVVYNNAIPYTPQSSNSSAAPAAANFVNSVVSKSPTSAPSSTPTTTSTATASPNPVIMVC
jgi:hypothetical protein